MTLAWNIIATRSPKEAVNSIMTELETLEMPAMSVAGDTGMFFLLYSS